MDILLFFILANYPFKETYSVSFLKSYKIAWKGVKNKNGKSKMVAYFLPKQNGFKIQLHPRNIEFHQQY